MVIRFSLLDAITNIGAQTMLVIMVTFILVTCVSFLTINKHLDKDLLNKPKANGLKLRPIHQLKQANISRFQ